jgi:hypothetical protein
MAREERLNRMPSSPRVGQPLVILSPLVEHAREQRARLAAAEGEAEYARMLSEYQALRAILIDLRGSRSYRLMRRLGRWRSIERGMRRARIE